MMKTLFLSVSDMRDLIDRVSLKTLTALIAERIRSDFLRWEDFEKSARTANHSPGGVIELMPVSDAARFSFKYVNGHPNNYRLGYPTVMAFGCLAQVETGFPILVAEMTLLTGIRTAATSVVAASALAKPNPRVMAMIGNGAQSEFQILAFRDHFGIETVHLFDTDPAATDKVMRNLADEPIELKGFGSTAEAVAGADIVTTSTADKTQATILTNDMIEPGMHLNAIGGDCPGKTELDPEILHRSRVFVEYTPQSRIEGELQQMPESFRVTELWEVLNGRQPGRQTAADVTLFDSVGFALEDFSALNTVFELAIEHRIGRPIHLVPEMSDVKDLYGLLQPAKVWA